MWNMETKAKKSTQVERVIFNVFKDEDKAIYEKLI